MSDQVFNNESTFSQKVEFLKDVYVYGKLYYDFIDFENLTITKQANISNLYVSGLSTFVGASAFQGTVSIASTATFNDIDAITLDVNHIDVGVATVRDRF